MATNFVQVESVEGIGVLKINRQESLNALNEAVLEQLESSLLELDGDAAVKAVVLTGAGDRSFVSGADIKMMLAMDPLGAQAFSRRGQRVVLLLEQMKKPVLAAVNGYALGGGLELALACDFIYASEKAKLGLTEVTLGIMPGFGGTQNLVRLIGPNRAKELIFSGRILTAQQARDWGIVNAVFPPDELMPRVMEVAGAIAGNGTLGVASAKEAITRGQDMDREGAFRYESALFSLLFATRDRKEGMQAFVEKRKADFKGR